MKIIWNINNNVAILVIKLKFKIYQTRIVNALIVSNSLVLLIGLIKLSS